MLSSISQCMLYDIRDRALSYYFAFCSSKRPAQNLQLHEIRILKNYIKSCGVALIFLDTAKETQKQSSKYDFYVQ